MSPFRACQGFCHKFHVVSVTFLGVKSSKISPTILGTCDFFLTPHIFNQHIRNKHHPHTPPKTWHIKPRVYIIFYTKNVPIKTNFIHRQQNKRSEMPINTEFYTNTYPYIFLSYTEKNSCKCESVRLTPQNYTLHVGERYDNTKITHHTRSVARGQAKVFTHLSHKRTKEQVSTWQVAFVQFNSF